MLYLSPLMASQPLPLFQLAVDYWPALVALSVTELVIGSLLIRWAWPRVKVKLMALWGRISKK